LAVERHIPNQLSQPAALSAGQLLAVFNTSSRQLSLSNRRLDHSSSHHRPKQAAAPHLIHTGNIPLPVGRCRCFPETELFGQLRRQIHTEILYLFWILDFGFWIKNPDIKGF
jgi:hypothetical protein